MSATVPTHLQEAGLTAYEQTRAFEAVRRKHLPLVYGALTLLLLVAGMVMMQINNEPLSILSFVAAAAFPVLSWLHWQRLKARYACNLELLADLEARYGEALPWRQVEKHLAALEKLQAELRAEAGES